MTTRKLRIANFIPSLSGGGAERVVINLCASFPRDEVQPVLIAGSLTGPFVDNIAGDVEVVDLKCANIRHTIGPLRDYVRQANLDLLISHLSHANIAALWAMRKLHKRNQGLKLPEVAVVEHMTMSAYRGAKWRDRFIRPLARRLYKSADRVVAVSNAAARDLEQQLRLPTSSVTTIYNPVVSAHIHDSRQEPLQHPFVEQRSEPLILAVGRLSAQKDYPTLIHAFAQLQPVAASRLAILGDGEERANIKALIDKLGLTERVCLVGFTDNPYQWMQRADLYVLSSRWEALPTVLIEAMACGCNFVSTDCPSGPAEILGERFAQRLTPCGDPIALATAIKQALDEPLDDAEVIRHASQFNFTTAAQRYIELLSRR
ncbi:MAG: glycosyltransferase [Planctomycetaceae bacterium]|jgi:glycosyltransferase involved in cell wall biosynthesis|nr:glycosyltransferase [Planctomycetaceae bacterium]MBT4012798.1 glycosyltransferase [Planctomycetaceae bacterium]MBT4725137.1 glycosyltransferase [Planctomycetaceae bacterium]MBT4846482.1 glycosyltransferase [Planctomycetaceae bacterium]MBT5124529.1 glycosyltransferase [Planctomycetaceae bacterium]